MLFDSAGFFYFVHNRVALFSAESAYLYTFCISENQPSVTLIHFFPRNVLMCVARTLAPVCSRRPVLQFSYACSCVFQPQQGNSYLFLLASFRPILWPRGGSVAAQLLGL